MKEIGNSPCIKIEFDDAAELQKYSQTVEFGNIIVSDGRKRKNLQPKKVKSSKNDELRVVMEPQVGVPVETKFDNNFKMTPQKNPDTSQQLHYKSASSLSFDDTSEDSSSKPSLVFLCGKCDTIYTTRSEFDQHYNKEHQSSPIYSCLVCSKLIPKFTSFRSHCYRHAYSERFKCTKCPKSFPVSSLLQAHLGAKHDEKPCDECEEKFESKLMLRVHKKIHAGGRVESKKETCSGGPCPDCGKFLLTSGGLYTHRKIHEDNPKFSCDLCGKKFIQKINLIHHHKKHIGLRPFACTFGDCDKSFMEKSHLIRHQNHHSTNRPYTCECCQKSYKTERCLKVHSQVHSNHRPFVCPECKKGFLSSSKLKQHSNIHSGNRPFKCRYCPRDFTNFPNWLKHTRRKHKIDHKTGEKLEVVPTYKKKVPAKPKEEVVAFPMPEAIAAPANNGGDAVMFAKAEPKMNVKLESESDVVMVTNPPLAAKYESDFMDETSAGGFNDFPDDIEFVLRNDPEYLDLLRTRVDMDNDSMNSGDNGEHSQEGIQGQPPTTTSSSNVLNDADILNNFTMPINSLYPILPLFNLPQPFQFINPNSIHLLNGQIMQQHCEQFRTQ